jgi:hypothetical protein
VVLRTHPGPMRSARHRLRYPASFPYERLCWPAVLLTATPPPAAPPLSGGAARSWCFPAATAGHPLPVATLYDAPDPAPSLEPSGGGGGRGRRRRRRGYRKRTEWIADSGLLPLKLQRRHLPPWDNQKYACLTPPVRTEWIVDSGASYHTTSDASLLSSVRPHTPLIRL